MTHNLLLAHLPWAPELHFKSSIALASLWSPSGFSCSKTKAELCTVSEPISPIYCLVLTEHQQTSSPEKTNPQAWQTPHTGSGQVNVTVIFFKSCLSFGPHSVSSSPWWSQIILYFQCSALELLLLCISHHVLSYTSETILFIFHHWQFTHWLCIWQGQQISSWFWITGCSGCPQLLCCFLGFAATMGRLSSWPGPRMLTRLPKSCVLIKRHSWCPFGSSSTGLFREGRHAVYTIRFSSTLGSPLWLEAQTNHLTLWKRFWFTTDTRTSKSSSFLYFTFKYTLYSWYMETFYYFWKWKLDISS